MTGVSGVTGSSPDRGGAVDTVVWLLEAGADEPLDPGDGSAAASLSQLDHALQTAQLLQAERPRDLELQLAGLLHDLGHLMGRPPGEVVGGRAGAGAGAGAGGDGATHGAGAGAGGDPGDDEQWHGERAATLVEPLLGTRVATLVRLHVPAKRYLVATDPGYRAVLSAESTASLVLQGGAMSETEAAQFAALEGSEDALVLRRADDRAKVPGLAVGTLDQWTGVLRQLVDQRSIQGGREAGE